MTLFDIPHEDDDINPGHLSRREDPGTSKQAAWALWASGKLGKMVTRAASIVKWHPGSTASELDDYAGVTDGAIRKRLNDAKKLGLIKQEGTRKCRVTGRNAILWWPTA